LLKVLEAEDNDKAQGLKDCIATKVDTSALTVEKPPVPDSVAEDLETMINDIANRHTGITAAEEKVLDEAKAMCQKDSVEVIQAKHDADQKQINDELAAVNQCDTVRESMSADVNQRNTVLGAARDDLKQARDEEARLKGIMDTATATLESFIQNADSTKPVYPMPDHSDKEAVLRWFDERMGWYTKNDHKYIELRAALKAAIEAYNAQVAVALASRLSSMQGCASGRPPLPTLAAPTRRAVTTPYQRSTPQRRMFTARRTNAARTGPRLSVSSASSISSRPIPTTGTWLTSAPSRMSTPST